MTYERDIEERISLWLEEEGVAHYPDRVLDATFEQTRKLRQAGSSPWRILPTLRFVGSLAAAGAAAVVLVAVGALGLSFLLNQQGIGGPPSDPRTPFLGTWISTSDADGGTQTMTVERADNNTVEIVVTDTISTVCSRTPSTMTGTGTIDGNNLVIPMPEYRCDDGSEPQTISGPPLEEQLHNLTYVYDPERDILTVGDGIWLRPRAEAPSPTPPSGLMWPQSTLDEVRAAQERADAGDPDYTWQVEAQLFTDADVWFTNQRGQSEIVGRFLREVLGWEAYELNPFEGIGNNGVYDAFYDQRYLRCAPGDTNPLYPPGPEPQWGELCAPTLDDLRYESVSLDLAQLVRQDSNGIFVVNRWRLTAPFVQADPVAVEARATERLQEFLAARIAGSGAEGYVEVQPNTDVPLLYATTSGAPYERYEIERVDGPRWPDASMTFLVRLFADDATVVQHKISSYQGGLWLDANSTTENGQPVAVSYTSADGEVNVSAPSPWNMWWPEADHVADVGVWFGLMERVSHESGTSIGFVDPVAYDAWCANNGGSPLLSASADAAAIAQQVIADANFETTAPVPARIGGLDAVAIDVALASGGEACRVGMIVISRWIHTIAWDPGLRLRLYLVDLPEGMSVQTLAITVVAPEERFEEVIEETAPIIESIEFHVP
jgi:hypothetical protein